MSIFSPHPGKLSLAAFGAGAAGLLYGSVRTLPHLRPGQVAVSLAAGAALVFLGCARLALLIALRPDVADALFVTPQELTRAMGGLARYDATVTFRRMPWLRWALFAAFLAMSAGALAELAHQAWMWHAYASTIPVYAGVLVVG